MSRNRKLYLSELLTRLDETSTHKDIHITVPKFNINWYYTSKEQAIIDQKNHFWNNEVLKYRVHNNELEILIKI